MQPCKICRSALRLEESDANALRVVCEWDSIRLRARVFHSAATSISKGWHRTLVRVDSCATISSSLPVLVAGSFFERTANTWISQVTGIGAVHCANRFHK
jgi:hypothetical protein